MSSKCPRCGKPSVGGTKGSRCRACLDELNRNRKNPNRGEHFDKLASDAKKRQRGQKSSKQTKKTKGLGTTQEIKNKMKAAYAKYGTSVTLSPDRIQNEKGYASSNVRAVPKILNRGKHKVDPKKLKAWKDRLKKSNVDLDILQKSVIQNAYNKGMPEIAIALEIRKDFLKKLLKK